jgi:RNA polymerase sigma-70 factor (ECF subfamily)
MQRLDTGRAQADRGDAAVARIVVELEEQHGQALFGFVRRQGMTDAQGQDAVQETLLRLWAALRAGERIESPRAWAYRAIYRLAMDEHRLRRRLTGLAERLIGAGRVEGFGPARDASDRIAVWMEVDRLPARQRQVLYLRYRSDLSFDEIGAVLGITSSAARSHATQALAALRRELDAPETE